MCTNEEPQAANQPERVPVMKSPEELTELFRSMGRKVTPQRQRIFRALQGEDSHPSAEWVYQVASTDMETISLKTVYQTLHELAELGEIQALDLGTGTTRFDPNVEISHHHLVCRSCGKVRDLFADFSGLSISASQAEGFVVGKAEVVFRGLCQECHEKLPTVPGLRPPPNSSINSQT